MHTHIENTSVHIADIHHWKNVKISCNREAAGQGRISYIISFTAENSIGNPALSCSCTVLGNFNMLPVHVKLVVKNLVYPS